MDVYTIERTPLTPQPAGKQTVEYSVKDVRLAVCKGIEVHIASSAICDPTAECWFAVTVCSNELGSRPSQLDVDVFLTNGHKYYRCRRIKGKSKLIFDKALATQLKEAVKAFSETIYGNNA